MSDFVAGLTGLPGPKTQWDGVATEADEPDMFVSSTDYNLIREACFELRAYTGTQVINVRNRGVVGDPGTDDGPALQALLNASHGVPIGIPQGRYRVDNPIVLSGRCNHIIGAFGGRFTEGGTEIVYSGSGPCFQIGTDSGNPWDSNEYNGPQDHIFENIWISHSAPDTALASFPGGGSRYKAGAYGIWDWRAGGITLRNIGVEKFEANFVGIQSDINNFSFITSLYSLYGFYFGPRSDQQTVDQFQSFLCDRAITIDRARCVRITNPQLIGVGTPTSAAIEIRRGSSQIHVLNPWFEHLNGTGYAGVDQLAFVSAGEIDGYGTGGSVQSPGAGTTSAATVVMIANPTIITELPATAGHTKYVASVGKCQQFALVRPGGIVGIAASNIDQLVGIQAAQAPTSADTQISIIGIPSTIASAKWFTNLGAGSPATDFETTGSGRTIASNVTLGLTTAAAHVLNGQITHNNPANITVGALQSQNLALNTATTTCIRGIHNGTVDTSGGFRQAVGLNGTSVSSRSAGGSSLENVGVLATASNGQNNFAIQALAGDVSLNLSSGATLLNRSVRFVNELVPAAISANQNNYSPASLSDATTLIVSATAPFNITGIATGASGRRLLVYNNSANTITLTNQDAASTAANRIIGRGGANTALTANTCVELHYSPSITRWLVVGDTL